MVARGERVRYVDAAKVLSEMPESLAASEGQNVRWEAGRIDVARRQVPNLLQFGLLRGSWSRLATALDLTVPPQSAQLLLITAGLAAAAVSGSRLLRRLALATVAGQAVYLAAGLARLGRGGARLDLLLHLPRYVAWKLWLYARVLGGGGSREWTRGHRAADLGENREEAVAAGS